MIRSLMMGSLCVCALASAGMADFVLVDDFETYTAGQNLNGVNGWAVTEGEGGLIVHYPAVDPASSSNMAFYQGTDSFHRSAVTMPAIAQGTTGTVFFRFYTVDTNGGDQTHWGPSDQSPSSLTSANDWAGWEAKVMARPDVPNDPGIYTRTNNTNYRLGSITDGAWWDCWIVIDNTNDQNTFYAQPSDGSAAGSSWGTYNFLNGSASFDIVSFYLHSAGSGTNAYIDDLYVDATGVNLTNPVPEPASMSLLGLGAIALIRRRR